jgi:hypothetical protein
MSKTNMPNNEEEALEGALSPIVNRLIDKNFEKSGDKIASQMAPLIGGAIREQIKSQKDDIVDALYPVMGNMISKFVTKSLEELLNKINQQIQNGLSFEAFKRKIKAKVKGVSETELLLEEHTHAKIKAALLIHKESGMLLAKIEDDTQTLSDADMLASMMTAIRSFVNEWATTDSQNHELGEIEYGSNKIIIEASGYSYLAVIVEGAAYTKTYEKIRHTLEKIVLEHGKEIKKFQGDFSILDKEAIGNELYKLLETSQEEPQNTQSKERKTHPLLYIVPLLLLSYLFYLSYKNYQDESLQELLTQKLLQTPQLIPFAIDIRVDDKKAILQGRVPFEYYKTLAAKKLEKTKGLQELKNEIKVIPTLTDPMQVSAHIAYLLKGFNLSNKTNISYDFDFTKLHLYGKIDSYQKKESLLHTLHKIKGIQVIEDSIKVITPPVKADIFFAKSSSKLSEEAKAKLLRILFQIQNKKSINSIKLDAYSDMIGSATVNKKLSQKRLQQIETFLQNASKKELHFQTNIHNTPPPGVNPKENPNLARRISLTTQIKEP